MKRSIYNCPICKKSHTIQLKDDFAENRDKYPFAYVFLHLYEGDSTDLNVMGKNILTTLFIDANNTIRGVDTFIQDQDADVVSKEEALTMIQHLTEHISKLQADYDHLLTKYEKLKK